MAPSIYHSSYFTPLLGQHRKECQLLRDLEPSLYIAFCIAMAQHIEKAFAKHYLQSAVLSSSSADGTYRTKCSFLSFIHT